jgi:hypothetical protein
MERQSPRTEEEDMGGILEIRSKAGLEEDQARRRVGC